MKHVLNVLKNEIFNQNKQTETLVQKVAVSQEAYMADRKNEALFNTWSDQVKELQKRESNMRYLKSAYVTICNACEVEPKSIDEILAEKGARVEKKNSRRQAKNTPKAVESSKQG